MANRIEKLTARVFCQLQHLSSGNPVTIFRSLPTLTHAQRQHLARSCAWESVFVSSTNNSMTFYLPTGEPISFCAHAAIGGAFRLFQEQPQPQDTSNIAESKDSSISSSIPLNMESSTPDRTEITARLHDGDIAGLNLHNVPYERSPILGPQRALLRRLLRDTLNVPTTNIMLPNNNYLPLPSFVNVSFMGRTKTLVLCNNVNDAVAPRDANAFERVCDTLETSGLYLYGPPENDDEDAWECRQFPRASGYPEDPATGVAAAGLAVGLYQLTKDHPTKVTTFKFKQGTAMGRPSLLLVDSIRVSETSEETKHEDGQDKESDDDDDSRDIKMPAPSQDVSRAMVSLELLGRVEVDESTNVNVPPTED